MERLKANWYWRITDLGFVLARLERVSRLSFPQTWKKHSVEDFACPSNAAKPAPYSHSTPATPVPPPPGALHPKCFPTSAGITISPGRAE